MSKLSFKNDEGSELFDGRPVSLPQPDWSRPGETWRVETEPFAEAEDGGLCLHRDRLKSSPKRYGPECHQPGVAVIGRRLGFVLCERHLREQRMWVEGNRVVSWALRP